MEQTPGNDKESRKEIERIPTVAKKILPNKKNTTGPSLCKKPRKKKLLYIPPQTSFNVKDLYMTKCYKLSKSLEIIVGLKLVVTRREVYKFQTMMIFTNEDNSVFIEFKHNCLDILHSSSGVLKLYYQNGGVDFGGLTTNQICVGASGRPGILFIFPARKGCESSQEILLSLHESELVELLRLRECIKQYGNAYMAIESVASKIFMFHVINITGRFGQLCWFYGKNFTIGMQW